MNIAEMQENIMLAIRANTPIMLWGPPGCGKTQGIQQFCVQNNYKLIDIRLSQMDAVDLRGIPFRDPETGRSDWALPKIWPTEDVDTIIMFDEINHATQGTLAAAFQIIQERSLGDFKFPPRVRFIAAGNRASDRTYANKMPSALCNRFVHFDIEPSVNDWCDWAVKNAIDPLITGFIRFSPTSLNEFVEHADTEEEKKRVALVKTRNAFAVPRSWDAVNRVLSINPNIKTIHHLLTGLIGVEQTTKFCGYVKYYKDLPDLRELLAGTLEYTVPNNPATQYALCAGLANIVDDTTFKSLVAFISKLPAEFQAMCIKDAVSRDMMLSTNPAFLTWADNNKETLF